MKRAAVEASGGAKMGHTKTTQKVRCMGCRVMVDRAEIVFVLRAPFTKLRGAGRCTECRRLGR